MDTDTSYHDYNRFSLLHSWYKHISIRGRTFYAYQEKGEQARNCVHPNIQDASGIHWHFSTTQPLDKASHIVEFGPFLRSFEYKGSMSSYSNLRIIIRSNETEFDAWIQEHYPQFANVDWLSLKYTDPCIEELFEKENAKHWSSFRSSLKIEQN